MTLGLFPFGALQSRHLVVSAQAYRMADGSRTVAYAEGVNCTVPYLQADFLGRPLHHRLLTNGYSMSGTLLGWSSDLEGQLLRCSWREEAGVAAPTIVTLPPGWFGGGCEVSLSPTGPGWTMREGAPALIEIPPTGQESHRELVVRF